MVAIRNGSQAPTPYFALVAEELNDGLSDDGLRARAVAESAGVDKVADARYIKLRAKALQDDMEGPWRL